MSTNKYQVINLPPDINSTRYHQFRLGKSVGGVHFAVADQQRLQVWFLDESGSKTEWVLKHVTRYPFSHYHTDRPWILQHGSYGYDDDKEENNREPTAAENDSDWDSDDADNAADIDLDSCPYIEVLGFHPYRDIVFLVFSRKVMAYYFNSSKIQHLGELLIRYCYQDIREGFVYTPTWIGELPGANYLVRSRNSYGIEEEDLLHSIED